MLLRGNGLPIARLLSTKIFAEAQVCAFVSESPFKRGIRTTTQLLNRRRRLAYQVLGLRKVATLCLRRAEDLRGAAGLRLPRIFAGRILLVMA